MPLEGIGAVTGVAGTAGVAGTGYLQRPQVSTGDGFAAHLGGAVDSVTALQGESDTLKIKALSGDLTDIHDATIASTRAQVTLELVAAVRNKAVDAFNEIMRLQA